MVMKEREVEECRKAEEESVDYAFHVHGDYSTEWVKCIEVSPDVPKYLIRTALLPNSIQEVSKHYLLLNNRNNA